ncbi:hypothetical protein [Nocardioides sp. B-3]|uniref:hypothetical protein n=1 Tax=Nocardioides sp. B-3 TaxID=2895565 RepID=UPI002152CA63|nr:hypothetical protein [Nocardioides sp. B-3]UUZ59745.1 hypothetical protein LP418_01070 [Nocardioides sp. B-3]
MAVRGHRRGNEWKNVTYAVHRRTDAPRPPDDHPPHWPEPDPAGWQLLMTGNGCFTGLTALEVWGVSLPPIPDGCPVFMALGKNDPRPMRRGVHTSRHIAQVDFAVVRGLRVATPAEALVAAARWLSKLDLVLVIDNALHRGLVDLDELVRISRTRRPGARALRAALPLVDGGAESLPETLLRLLHVWCDVEVETQCIPVDENGVEIARTDIWLVGTTSHHEYDGDEHEKAPRRVKDLQRSRRIDKAGHVRRGYTLGDLLHRSVPVLEDMDRAVGRQHDPLRIRPWVELIRQSLYFPSGRAAFLERVPTCPPRRRGGGA